MQIKILGVVISVNICEIKDRKFHVNLESRRRLLKFLCSMYETAERRLPLDARFLKNKNKRNLELIIVTNFTGF